MTAQLSRQFDLVFVLPCLDGQELDYLRNNPALAAYLEVRPDGSTSIPVMSVIRAKGLEFQRVVLYGFGQDCRYDLDWGGALDNQPEHKIRHEYFLNRLYVGATRARSQLMLIDDTDAFARFWTPLQNGWEPPVNLQQLPESAAVWQHQLGTLRAATLEDITPDAQQIRFMLENADTLRQQGLDDQDAFLLRQAAGLYGQLGDFHQQAYCLAEVLFLEENYSAAAREFESLNSMDRAWDGDFATALVPYPQRLGTPPFRDGCDRLAVMSYQKKGLGCPSCNGFS